MTESEISARIDELYRAAALAVPEVTVALADFARVVNRAFGDATLDGDAAAALYLATAIVARDPTALAVFERDYIARVPASLGRLRLGAAELAEVQQIVREKLLVAVGDRAPRIVELAGRGALGGLVRVVAMRTALNLQRSAARRTEDRSDDLIEHLADKLDVARVVIERDSRALVARAISGAVERLDPSQRNLLRLHLLQRLGIDEIARLHHVHRATAARWLGRLRDQLRHDTRATLAEQISTVGVDSLLQLVDSRLEISFARLLASGPE